MDRQSIGKSNRIGFFSFLILSPALMLFNGQNQEARFRDISVRLLNSEKKIIPIYFQYDPIWHSDIKLPPIVLKNMSGAEISLERCVIAAKSGGHEVIRATIGKERVAADVLESGKLINRLLSNPGDLWKPYNLKKRFGNVSEKGRFNETAKLQTGEKACLTFADRVSLHYAGPEKIDEMSIQIFARMSGNDISADFPVVLTPYACKGKYIFPVPGSATVGLTPVNGHRMLQSSEFAVDINDNRRLVDGQLSPSDPPRSSKVADYFAFNRDVVAVGDGEVVMTGNDWPDKPMDNPLLYSEKRVYDLTVGLIKKGVEFQNAYLGNYVIIDHQNGEFSAYVHLAQNTIAVRSRDKVVQGQVIGRIGNTANSTDPHLHFQLMDSSDYAAANGLPVMFTNLPTPLLSVWDMNIANTLFYSDYLFVHTTKPSSGQAGEKK